MDAIVKFLFILFSIVFGIQVIFTLLEQFLAAFWEPLLAVLGIGVAIAIATSFARVAEQERAALSAVQAELRRRRGQLATIAHAALLKFEELPQSLERAEAELDRAEAEFRDRAFDPFWSAIEGATQALATFSQDVGVIRSNAAAFLTMAGDAGVPQPQFPIGADAIKRLGVSGRTAERLRAIVGTAQRDFQFAQIYQLRRTNQILIAGFQSLSAALEGLDMTIGEGLSHLSGAVDQLATSTRLGCEAIATELADGNAVERERLEEARESARAARGHYDDQRRGLAGLNRELTGARHALTDQVAVSKENFRHTRQVAERMERRHEEALEMLDNMQRRRPPSKPSRFDRS